MTLEYPKRLIEVDLPIKRISAHSRREKSIRHGHISTLHIWWARRPLAACRAVICAALWPDPADALCPESFRETARTLMREWASENLKLLGEESLKRFDGFQKDPSKLEDNEELRNALLDFIADFANWDNSTNKEFLETSRALTQAAHEALGGAPGTRPLVVDPFAGGGSIPLEALRVGADAVASDLNPVAVLLNKVVLEYIPKYGQRLADEVRKWGEWIKKEAEKELAEFYPKDADGATPIAYLWARTIQCEGPRCGAEVPLIRSLWLAKKPNRSVALQLVPKPKTKQIAVQIIVKQRHGWVDQADNKIKIETPQFDGTSKAASATCPRCGFTTPKMSVREQLCKRRGGANDARLLCVVTTRDEKSGRTYRQPTDTDLWAIRRAADRLQTVEAKSSGKFSLLPDEEILQERVWKNNPIRVHLYGITRWRDIFTDRQALALATFSKLVKECGAQIANSGDIELSDAVQACLALAVDRCADKCASLVVWHLTGEKVEHVFGRQALPMVWDFADGNPLSEIGWPGACEWIVRALESNVKVGLHAGHVERGSATAHPLPDDSAQAFITDPPYYDAVPYSTLSNFFYVWLKRTVPMSLSHFFNETLAPNAEECVVDEAKGKTHSFYEAKMTDAMAEGRRVLNPAGIGLIVFAHKSTSGWEAMIQAIIDAGWIVTGSWPIDTEMGTRLRARDSATLASSVHLVCRPRENPNGSLREEVGDWRDVLHLLPQRIHDWLPRLAAEGVVGADAIFACLGPALEVFSRYSRVEKASGHKVELRDYLEEVWAAVAKEALTMVFVGADATGFEEDARLTAMWLWTLSARVNGNAVQVDGIDEQDDAEERSGKKKRIISGYTLEFDAARKIAQGLGAHLEDLNSVVEAKGETARLLPVAERARFLFGKQEEESPRQRKKRKPQLDLFEAGKLEEENAGGFRGDLTARAGQTVLDRVHQSMILFGAGRSEALKRFLVEEGVGRDQRFWRLAQALAALYPTNTDERRWVEGVLARKKGLGF